MTIVPLRSVLFVPAAHPRALAKSAQLVADALIFDLEDSALPEMKADAREALRRHLGALPQPAPQGRPLRMVRINRLDSAEGTEDFLMARYAASPARGGIDAIVLPKVESAKDVTLAAEALDDSDAPAGLRLLAMIETPKGVLAAAEIAAASPRLSALIVGPNDIVAATGLRVAAGRQQLLPWLAQIVLAAKAHGLAAIDGVYNDIGDEAGLVAECAAGRDMGFDGKTLIHPSQIEPADLAFAPSKDDIAGAEAVVSAFAAPEAAGRGVIRLDGRMVERMHLDAARRLLAFAALTRPPTARTDR